MGGAGGGGKLSVVIYENDSVDGTRDMIKEWRGRKNNYAVDLITCEDEGDEEDVGVSTTLSTRYWRKHLRLQGRCLHTNLLPHLQRQTPLGRLLSAQMAQT